MTDKITFGSAKKPTRSPSAISQATATGKIWVSSQYQRSGQPVGEENREEKKLEVVRFEVEPAWVKAGYGATVNLGNYESLRCDAGVTLPCYAVPSEIAAAMEEARRIAEECIENPVEEAKSSRR